ncbi:MULTISPECIES: hypothetical protein [unclassified Streptomyces]|uniref:hypothetical protein n=1 Tax=unclassified Streptomyces TaxID=2593676 RepID=UPI001CBA8C4F|nr:MULTISPECIES: hypothetical protein [unclassified Streptomyces]WPO70611.1 hypothetical protein R9806_08230 [Streptomyces sp. KN37]
MSATAEAAAAAAPRTRDVLRHVLLHLVTPLLMCLGMGLAYMGAFVTPEPNDMPIAVVGSGPQAKVLAQTVEDKAGDALDVRTLPDREHAVDALKSLDIAGAFVPDARTPELIVASAGSDMSALAAQKIFTPLAAEQGAPLKVTDVAKPVADDPTGQGLFFLLVAVSIGSYASVAVLGAAGAGLRMRARAGLVVGVSFAVSLIGAALAGPIFHLAHQGLWGVWAMCWLYSAGVLFIGVGLHTFLKRWTTLTMMVLFVMLNFTTSGGLFRPELQNGFFGSLHAFWNGAGFVEGVRSHLYFGGHDLGSHVWTLAGWLALGVLLVGVAGLWERRGRGAAVAAAREADRADQEEEMEESVGV